jgi:hypothetical protein
MISGISRFHVDLNSKLLGKIETSMKNGALHLFGGQVCSESEA